MLYFSYTRSASGYTKAVFQSIFPRFFVVNAQFVYEEMYLTLNSDIGSLLVRIDRVALKREWKLYFLEWETVFCSQFSPRNTGNRFLGLWNFPKIFWGTRPQTPLEEGDYGLLVDTVGSVQTCRLLQFLLKRLVTWDSLICILNAGCPPVLGSP